VAAAKSGGMAGWQSWLRTGVARRRYLPAKQARPATGSAGGGCTAAAQLLWRHRRICVGICRRRGSALISGGWRRCWRKRYRYRHPADALISLAGGWQLA